MSKTTKADIDAAREYYETHSVEDEIDKSVPGEPITSPMSGYSVRLPTDVLEQARKIAGERGMTTGAWLREAIENAVAAQTAAVSEVSGAVPVAEILALVAKHSDASPQPGHDEPLPAADVPAPAAAAGPADFLRGLPGVLVVDYPAPIDPVAGAWAGLDRFVDEERTEQAVRDWVEKCRALYRGRVALTGTDVAWPSGAVKWVRASGDGIEVSRAGNTIKRHTVPQRAPGRRHPKT